MSLGRKIFDENTEHQLYGPMCIYPLIHAAHLPDVYMLRSAGHDGEKRRQRGAGDKRYNFTPVSFMASEQMIGKGDDGEVRRSPNYFSLVSAFV